MASKLDKEENEIGLRHGDCRFWPVREYPWGSCEALSSRHSDLAALKKLLFEVSPVQTACAKSPRRADSMLVFCKLSALFLFIFFVQKSSTMLLA